MHNRTILVTGGTGSLGKHLVKRLLKEDVKKIIVYSRDEFKQAELERETKDKRLRYILGDVRDYNALNRSFSGVDIVLHTAALKRVEACEYNPFEAIKTNILGAQNIIDAAIENGVEKVLAVSTDKAVNPINLYGATKLCADKLFTAADAYAAGKTVFSVVRFGNFTGSRGSVLPLWKKQEENSKRLTITDRHMTRFFISLDKAVDRTFEVLKLMQGGEVFCPKMPSVKMIDVAKSIRPYGITEIGMRQGEKLHEHMIIQEDAPNTYELDNFFVTANKYRGKGKKVPLHFSYTSDQNWDWMDASSLTNG